MIQAQFFHKDGKITGFSVTGHAGWAESGRDIVCAGVSSAVQMAANTITEVLHERARVSAKADTVALKLGRGGGRAAQAVLEGLRFHLSLLAGQYRGAVAVEDSEEDERA